MQRQFESNIIKKKLFAKKDKLLLAISGGIDSVVLAQLLKSGNYQFSLAHCNFNLRGKDSEADEKFCRQLAEKNNLELFIKQFDVKKYCREKKVSTQMAARDLRYEWFGELLAKEKFDYILTAHQASDVVETVLINLLRGTGINGLKGIPEKNGNVVRPLLQFAKQEITDFAKINRIKFRLDKSNLKDDYQRNFIRLNVIPEIKKINPDLESTFVKNSRHLLEESLIVKEFLAQKARNLVSVRNSEVFIDRIKLMKEVYQETILHSLLSPFGFNSTQQENILDNLSGGGVTGKIFTAQNNKLVIERTALVISQSPVKLLSDTKFNSLEEIAGYQNFRISSESRISRPEKNELYVDSKRLVFPLTIRTKKTGDKFRPFGMKGFKLISDFFKDEKLSSSEKEKVKLLVNGNGEILWVIGYRTDERYRINPDNKPFLKILFVE